MRLTLTPRTISVVGIFSIFMLSGCKESVAEFNKETRDLLTENEELTDKLSDLSRRLDALNTSKEALARNVGEHGGAEAREQKLNEEMGSLKAETGQAEQSVAQLSAIVDNLQKKYLYK